MARNDKNTRTRTSGTTSGAVSSQRLPPVVRSQTSPPSQASNWSGHVHLPSQPPSPVHRHLRGYAFDPSLATQLETAQVSEVVFKVPWEKLEPGPIGEYVEVVDYDPASGCFYHPVDLDDPRILAQNGLAPTEGNPQFHQQMVYAAVMTTINRFERALGRHAMWPDRFSRTEQISEDERYVQRLRIPSSWTTPRRFTRAGRSWSRRCSMPSC